MEGAMGSMMSDQYDVVVRRCAQGQGEPDPVKFGRVLMVTLDEFGTLTVEATGIIQSFQRDAWEGFSVTKAQQVSRT
jgi:hypothetical protein